MFDTLMVFLKIFLEKVNFEKKAADDKKHVEYYPACKELIDSTFFDIHNIAFHLIMC